MLPASLCTSSHDHLLFRLYQQRLCTLYQPALVFQLACMSSTGMRGIYFVMLVLGARGIVWYRLWYYMPCCVGLWLGLIGTVLVTMLHSLLHICCTGAVLCVPCLCSHICYTRVILGSRSLCGVLCGVFPVSRRECCVVYAVTLPLCLLLLLMQLLPWLFQTVGLVITLVHITLVHTARFNSWRCICCICCCHKCGLQDTFVTLLTWGWEVCEGVFQSL